MLAGSVRAAYFYSDASGPSYEAAQELTAAERPVGVAYRGEEQIKTAAGGAL